MARLIIVAALLWLGWLFYRRLKRQRQPHPPTPLSGERMVRCAYCHAHVSRHDALEDPHVNELSRHLPGEKYWFCCQDHQARFISNGPKPRRRSSS